MSSARCIASLGLAPPPPPPPPDAARGVAPPSAISTSEPPPPPWAAPAEEEEAMPPAAAAVVPSEEQRPPGSRLLPGVRLPIDPSPLTERETEAATDCSASTCSPSTSWLSALEF